MAESKGSELILLSSKASGVVARASSVLQRNVKQYGPMNALNIEDGSSCWYSEGVGDDENVTQSYTITFPRQVAPKEVRIQFQAGFSAEECQVHIRSSQSTWEMLEEIEPSDTHELQIFPLSNSKAADAMKIVFDECTDFYGRIMVYRLGIYGVDVTNDK